MAPKLVAMTARPEKKNRSKHEEEEDDEYGGYSTAYLPSKTTHRAKERNQGPLKK